MRARKTELEAYDLEEGSLRSVEDTRRRCYDSLAEFVRSGWRILEPEAKYVPGWHIDAMCEHLEAITDGRINRLLINVPPGSMKSLTVSVFWPAWEWGPRGLASLRYIATSFKEDAVHRDNRRMRALVMSEWYQRHWPIELVRMGEVSFENAQTGWREGVSFSSLTSKRGDRLICDDVHSVEGAESKADRERTVTRFRESAVNRLNDQAASAIVVVMQRLHEADVAGVILENDMGYEALVLPMEYESGRHCATSIGFSDPRTKDGELLCEERFPLEVVRQLKSDMQAYAFAGQYQQRPAPRGGGIFPYNSWEYWDKSLANKYGRNESQFPDFDYVVASVDGAFTEKTENDFTAMVTLGIWTDLYGFSQAMVISAWAERLRFHDAVERIIVQARKKPRPDRVLIENKATGISVSQEIVRMTMEEEFSVQLVNPGAENKVSRAHPISEFHREEKEDGSTRAGLVYVPVITQASGAQWPRAWADMLMSQAASFPKGKHDDLVDAYVQGMRYLRACGYLRRRQEGETEQARALMRPPTPPPPLYPG